MHSQTRKSEMSISQAAHEEDIARTIDKGNKKIEESKYEDDDYDEY